MGCSTQERPCNKCFNKSGGGSMGCSTQERPCNKFHNNEVPGAGEYEISRTKDGRLDTAGHANKSFNKSGGGSMGCSTQERPCNKFHNNEVQGAGEYEIS